MKPLISSVRVEVLGGHAHVTVWNRGGCAGTIVVNADDGAKVAERLIPNGENESLPSGLLWRRPTA